MNSRSITPGTMVFWGFCSLLLILVVGHAWVTEDAFITFRVVDNFVHGYGLRWNIDERVEAFTNPLWLLLHILIRALHRNIFLGTIILSVLCVGAAVYFAARSAQKSRGMTALVLILPLILSKTFLEFATSGLENPLSFLLTALFVWVLLTRGREPETTPWFLLSGLVALAAVNRLDSVLLYVPVLGYLLVTRRQHIRWGAILAGMSPIVVWEAFSLIYYGFLVPNTAYSKLATGVSRSAYLKQGLFYLLDFLRRDPVGFLIAAAVAVGALVAFARRKGGILTYLAVGCIVYGAYIVSVGGDFMSLRLWSLPLFLSILVLYVAMPNFTTTRTFAMTGLCLGMIRALALWTGPHETQGISGAQKVWHNIEDERLRYVEGHTLFSLRRRPHFRFNIRLWEPTFPQAVMWWAVGLKPYVSGPDVIVVDAVGLADPLLSHLPAIPRESLYIGHFRREIPKGYMAARITRDWSLIADPNLRQYYEKIRLITAGPLFQGERLKTILAFNLGRYDDLRAKFLATPERYEDIADGQRFFFAEVMAQTPGDKPPVKPDTGP